MGNEPIDDARDGRDHRDEADDADPAARGGWDGNSNEPLLHDEADDEDDVEGFGFSIGLPVDALKPEGPPIRGVLDGITLPSLGAMTSQTPRRDPLGLAGYAANANEPIVVDRDR